MEYIRRGLKHVIKSSPDRYIGDGNFLTRLREQRAIEEAQRLRDRERISVERERLLAQKKADNEAKRLQQEAAQAEAARQAVIEAEKARLRNEALDASQAPSLLGQLSEELSRPLVREGSHLYIELSNIPIYKGVMSDDRMHHEDWYEAITAYGLEDGSVLIGSRILKPSDARSISKVDAAIERNYRKPSIRVVRYDIQVTEEDSSRYESWNSGGW